MQEVQVVAAVQVKQGDWQLEQTVMLLKYPEGQNV
jgi:hypothetical protein